MIHYVSSLLYIVPLLKLGSPLQLFCSMLARTKKDVQRMMVLSWSMLSSLVHCSSLMLCSTSNMAARGLISHDQHFWYQYNERHCSYAPSCSSLALCSISTTAAEGFTKLPSAVLAEPKTLLTCIVHHVNRFVWPQFSELIMFKECTLCRYLCG